MLEVLLGTLSGLHCLQAGSQPNWLSFPPTAGLCSAAKSIIFEFKMISFIFFTRMYVYPNKNLHSYIKFNFLKISGRAADLESLWMSHT